MELWTVLYRTQSHLEHSTISDSKPTELTSARAATQSRSDQSVTSEAYSRHIADGHVSVRENGTVETMHHHDPTSFHNETHEPRCGNVIYFTYITDSPVLSTLSSTLKMLCLCIVCFSFCTYFTLPVKSI